MLWKYWNTNALFSVDWQEDDTYRATLILQHDKELIMPGDGAFDLQCDNRRRDSNGLELFVFSINFISQAY